MAGSAWEKLRIGDSPSAPTGACAFIAVGAPSASGVAIASRRFEPLRWRCLSQTGNLATMKPSRWRCMSLATRSFEAAGAGVAISLFSFQTPLLGGPLLRERQQVAGVVLVLVPLGSAVLAGVPQLPAVPLADLAARLAPPGRLGLRALDDHGGWRSTTADSGRRRDKTRRNPKATACPGTIRNH